MIDLISRQAAIELIERMKPYHQDADDIVEMIANMPPEQPEQFTDNEQRIFFAAMTREELICLHIDEEHNDPNLINLVEVCHEIMRKVKNALWT